MKADELVKEAVLEFKERMYSIVDHMGMDLHLDEWKVDADVDAAADHGVTMFDAEGRPHSSSMADPVDADGNEEGDVETEMDEEVEIVGMKKVSATSGISTPPTKMRRIESLD